MFLEEAIRQKLLPQTTARGPETWNHTRSKDRPARVPIMLLAGWARIQR